MYLLEQAQQAMEGGLRENAQTILELASNPKSLWLSRSAFERKDFLEKIHSNCLTRGVTIEIYLRKTLEILEEMKKKDSWRPLVDDFRTESAEVHGGPNP